MQERTCSIDGCDRPRATRGWCRMHYSRWKRHGDPLKTLSPNFIVGTVEERFWGKVGPEGEGGCRPWIGSRDNYGYGNFKFGNKVMKAHRLAYQLQVGPVPDGLFLDHKCHSSDPSCAGGRSCKHRLCVNPDHLEPVTNQENIARGRVSGKTHCKNGHPFDDQNTRITKRGYRECIACARANSLRNSRRVK